MFVLHFCVINYTIIIKNHLRIRFFSENYMTENFLEEIIERIKTSGELIFLKMCASDLLDVIQVV